MALFNRNRSSDLQVLQVRLQRLRADRRGLAGVDDSARLERLRDDAWALMFDAGRQLHSGDGAMEPGLSFAGSFPARRLTGRYRGMRPLALLLLAAAQMSLLYEMAAKDWRRAVLAGYSVSLAVATLSVDGDPATQRDLGAVLKHVPDLAAYASHRADLPEAATMILEAVTSLMLDDRMMDRSAQAYAQRPGARPDLERLLGQVRGLIAGSSAPAVQQAATAAGTRTPFEEFAALLDAGMQEDLARIAATAGNPGPHGPASAYLLTSAPTQAVMTAGTSHRSLIYVLAAHHGGAALRVPSSGEPRMESIELPGLTFSAVADLLGRIQALAHDKQLRTRRPRAAHIDALLDDVGSAVWIPILEAWPAIRNEPVAVVPVGETALLPLFTARTEGTPICVHADLTLTPSARALFLADELKPRGDRAVLVAADPSPGQCAIPRVTDEALSVAAVHGTQALIMNSGRRVAHEANSSCQREFTEQLASASIVHLACHGQLAEGDPLDSSLVIGTGMRLGQLLKETLAPGSLMVLSACELGGIGLDHPNEQMGFPGALLAAGARSVVGALWSVPDHPDTIKFMIDYHQRLQKESSNLALGHAISEAQHAGVLSTVWAPFTHFGASSPPRLP